MSSRRGPRDHKEGDVRPEQRPGWSGGTWTDPSLDWDPMFEPRSARAEFLARGARGPPSDPASREARADPDAPDPFSGRWEKAPEPHDVPSGGPGAALPRPAAEVPSSRSRLESVAKGLEAFGLRKSTSRLYCAALTVGPAFPLEIILSARVSRATGYRGLERLRRMELVVPVGQQPIRMEAVPLARFLDRSATALRDEVDLHREMREVAAQAFSQPNSARDAQAAGLFGSGEVARVLQDSLAQTRRELLIIPVLKGLPSEARSVLRQGLLEALSRKVRVRVLMPYEPAYLRILTSLWRAERSAQYLQARLSEPAFFHLYVTDSTKAIRFFVRTTPSDRPSGTLGLVSERRSFVQAQEQRFRALWSEAPSLEMPDLGPRRASDPL